MKVTDKIENAIAAYTPGEVFKFNELGLIPDEYIAGVKAVSRMVKSGALRRASTGKYYKLNQTPFGELKPGEDELLKTYLFADGKRIAYITGPTLYNRLGLTTQIPRTVQVASRDKRIVAKVGNLKVKAVKSYVDVTDSNYQVLGLLDAIKDFKDIPDQNTETVLIRLKTLIMELSNIQQRELATLSLRYPPRARALTGALLDWNKADNKLTKPIAGTLNPLSVYNFAISKNLLPPADKWNIK